MLLKIIKDIYKSSSKKEEGASLPLPKYKRGGQIVAFLGGSRGGALAAQIMENMRPFEKMAEKITYVECPADFNTEFFNNVFKEPVWFAISHFGVGEVFPWGGAEGFNPWLIGGVPFLRIYGDVPAYFPARHYQHYPNSVNVYAHKEHFDFYKSFFQRRGISICVDTCLFDIENFENIDFDRKKSGRILFAKNGNSHASLIKYWVDSLPPLVSAVLCECAEIMRSKLDEKFDPVGVLVSLFNRRGVDVSSSKYILFFMVAQIDDYIRRIKSTLIAESIIDFPVVVRGENWGHVDFLNKNAILDSDSNYFRTRNVMDQSLAIIDMSPNTCFSPHDRVLRAAGRYAAFFSNFQDFYLSNFDCSDRFLFKFTRDSISERMEYAISNPEEIVELGVSQAKRMRQLFTFKAFSEQLVDAVDLAALGVGGRPEGTQDFVDFSFLNY